MTLAIKASSDIFSILAVFELGLTFTEIFIFNTISKTGFHFINHSSNVKEGVTMPATESEFKGNPMIVLSQGPDDKFPFQFGLKKAKLVLENLEEIKKFVEKHSGEKG